MSGSAQGGRDLWGGHFASGPAPLMEQINASIDFDKRLYDQDIRGSAAHARMLEKVGLLSETEVRSLLGALSEILSTWEKEQFEIPHELEDCHTTIESILVEKCGEAGKPCGTQGYVVSAETKENGCHFGCKGPTSLLMGSNACKFDAVMECKLKCAAPLATTATTAAR
mgnify:CR=1 FL=1